MEKSQNSTKLIDVMKAIPLSEIPQSFFFYKNHPSGKSVNSRVLDSQTMKERQYWLQIEQWIRENEAPSEDIFLKMISKRLFDKRIYTGVNGKSSFVQSILS
jgi:hypothetical protein